MKYPGFCGPSYSAQSPIVAQERTVNFYEEVSEVEGEKDDIHLYPTPGVEEFAVAGENPGRASFHQNGRAWVVIGETFYEVLSNGTLTSRGTVAVDVGTDPATISSNGDGGGQLFVVSGGKGYRYTLADNDFDEVVSSGCDMGAHVDGYFMYLERASSTWFISGLYDGDTWDALQFQQRSAANDRWKSIAVLDRDIYLIGDETSEVWYNAGTTPFPFALHPSGLIPYGTAAPWSVKRVGDSLCWLVRTNRGQGSVVKVSGFAPEFISNKALEFAFRNYTTLEDAVGDSYDEEGHAFYLLTFPTANRTWVYDLAAPKLHWCERGTWDADASDYDAWRPLYHFFAFNKHLVCDRSAGTVYEMSLNFANDVDGALIRRWRRAPIISIENKRLFFKFFTLDCQVGIGNASPPGDDPRVSLNYTNDNGRTWYAAEQRRAGDGGDDFDAPGADEDWNVPFGTSAGGIGEFSTRVIWNRQGSGRRRGYEVVMSDPVPWRLSGAFVDVRSGATGR